MMLIFEIFMLYADVKRTEESVKNNISNVSQDSENSGHISAWWGEFSQKNTTIKYG